MKKKRGGGSTLKNQKCRFFQNERAYHFQTFRDRQLVINRVNEGETVVINLPEVSLETLLEKCIRDYESFIEALHTIRLAQMAIKLLQCDDCYSIVLRCEFQNV